MKLSLYNTPAGPAQVETPQQKGNRHRLTQQTETLLFPPALIRKNNSGGNMPRSLTQITDLTAAEVNEIFDLCGKMKRKEIAPKPLEGKSVACIFTKPSLRTRISFEVGISELGGSPIYVTDPEIQLGKRETVAD